MSGSRQDRMLNVIGLATLATVVVILGTAVFTVWRVLDQGDTLDAQARSDELTACRSEYAAELTDAQNAVDDAESRRDDLIFLGLLAVATDDEGSLAGQVAQSEEVTTMIARERRALDEVARRRSAAITLSRADPEEFLSGCRSDFG